jgi:hypothetical protein
MSGSATDDARHRQLLLAIVMLFGASSTQHAMVGATRQDSPPAAAITINPLTAALRTVLRQQNPAIERVAILELRAASPDGPYVLIGWGIRADRRFDGNFRDELFGVFVVNNELTRIDRTLEIIPTPRWLDYSLRVDEIVPWQVTVVGRGATYGDGAIRRVYRLEQ